MTIIPIITPDNLGPEFDPGNEIAGKYTLKLDGSTITRDPATGELKAAGEPMFTIDGTNANKPLIGDTGIQFQMVAYDVTKGPISWAVESAIGDVENVTIDV